jgi:hypothetical protein
LKDGRCGVRGEDPFRPIIRRKYNEKAENDKVLTTELLETFLSQRRHSLGRRVNSRQQILATMSGTIMTKLFCWVIGTPTKQIFPAEIEPDKQWGHVKDAIKKKENEFADIDADTLDLWKVRHCPISHVVMLNSQFKRSPSVVPNFPSWNQKIS